MHSGRRSTQYVLKLARQVCYNCELLSVSTLALVSHMAGLQTQPFTRKIINEGTMLSNGYCAGISLQALRLCMKRLQLFALLTHVEP